MDCYPLLILVGEMLQEMRESCIRYKVFEEL